MNLPKDKFDIKTATALKGMPAESLRPYISELLVWLQDMNWPVSKLIAEALVKCNDDLIEPIRLILHGNDPIWKMWVISELLCHTAPNVRISLQNEIERLVRNPTEDEKQEGVVKAARDVMFLLAYNDLDEDVQPPAPADAR
jgi:hypothetical protein